MELNGNQRDWLDKEENENNLIENKNILHNSHNHSSHNNNNNNNQNNTQNNNSQNNNQNKLHHSQNHPHNSITPIYVNARQYTRILKRREARLLIEAKLQLNHPRKRYLHESRHNHACKRPRGTGGRFLTKAEIETLQTKGKISEDIEENHHDVNNHNHSLNHTHNHNDTHIDVDVDDNFILNENTKKDSQLDLDSIENS